MSFIDRPYTKKLIKDLNVGEVTLHPLYRSDGLLLIDKNRTLNEGLINIIHKHLIPYASVLVATSLEDFLEFVKNDCADTKEFLNELKAMAKEYQSNNTRFSEESDTKKEQGEEGSIFVQQLLSCPYWILLERKLDSDHAKKRCRAVKEGLIKILNDNKVFDLR